MAKNKGKIREHHFAHHGDMNCAGARMTALHLLAQQIIKNKKTVMLPNYDGEFYQKELPLCKFDKVSLEESVRLGDNSLLRPDCIGSYTDTMGKEHKLWIEIFVTHDIKQDGGKYNIIRQSNISCIEIDLSSLLKTDYTEESITKVLVRSKNNRKWICCPNYDAKNEKLRLQHQQEEDAKHEEEIRLIQEKKKHEEFLSNMVIDWYETKDSQLAKQIIKEIRYNPYDGTMSDFCICNILIPNYDFLHYIDNSPKNQDGLIVFYTLLRYYYNRTDLNYEDIKPHLKSMQTSRSKVTPEMQIKYEELISFNVIFWLKTRSSGYYSQYDGIQTLIKKYINIPAFRGEILMLSSILFHHVVGSTCSTFGELVKEIIDNHPSIASLFLKIVESQKKYPNNYSLNNQDMLPLLKKFVDENETKTDSNIQKVIETVFPFVFKSKYEKREDVKASYDEDSARNYLAIGSPSVYDPWTKELIKYVK